MCFNFVFKVVVGISVPIIRNKKSLRRLSLEGLSIVDRKSYGHYALTASLKALAPENLGFFLPVTED